MKKNKNLLIALLILIICVAIGIFVITKIKNNSKDYEIETISEYNYFVLKQNDKFGVINASGKKLINAEYNNVVIPNPSKAVFVCQAENETKILNENNEQILKGFESIEPIRLKNIASDLMYEKTVLKCKKDGKYGLIDFQGKQIAKAQYDAIDALPYKEGELLVETNGKFGVINIKGNTIIKCEYEKVTVDNYYTQENKYKNAGYIVATKTNEGYRYGYIDSKGKIILNTEYNDISRISEINDDENIYLISAKNGQYGLTKNNKELTDNEYQSMTYNTSVNAIVAEKSKKYGVIDIEGKVIVPVEYKQIDVNGMYIYATNEQNTEVFDAKGKKVKMSPDTAKVETENYIITITNKDNQTKYGVEDKEGNRLIEEKYSYIEYLFDDYFIASNEDGKLGVIDKNGKEMVELKYDSVQRITNKNMIQAVLSSNNTTQIYSKKLKKVFEIKNATIEKNDNYVKAYNETQRQYFDNNGEVLKNTELFAENKLFSKEENGKYGFVDKDKNVKVDYKYEYTTEFNKYGFAGIKQNGKWGIIDTEGNIVKEPTYEISSQIEPDFIGEFYKVTYGFGEFYYTDEK